MKTKLWAACLVTIALAACGGGGGGDDDTPPPAGPSSDLAVTLAAPAQPVPAGTPATFAVAVVNNGPDAAANVTLTSSAGGPVAGLLTVYVASCTASGGAACPTVLATTMTVPALPNGGRLRFELIGNLPAGSSGALAVNFTAAAAADGTAANNTATATATAYSADVSIATAAPATAVPAGSNANYTLTIGNAGPDTARDVVVAATAGAGLTLGTPTCVASGGATCPASLGASSTVAVLPSGGQIVLTVPAMVIAGTNGAIRLDASVAAAGDPVAGNNAAGAIANAYSANVSVSLSTATFVAAGSTATFVGTISNAGPATAQNLAVAQTLSAGYSAGTVTCVAAGGATCPPSFAATTTVPVLPVGGSLTLTIPVPVGMAQRGAIVGQLALTSAGDPAAADNTSSATTTARDPRSGDYVMHSTNGFQYTFTLDADAATYAVVGNGVNASGSAPYDAAGGWFVIAGNARFRTYEDVVIGAFDVGAGVQPFFAARRFLTEVSQLSGSFNQLRRYIPPSGPNDSFIGQVRLQNGVYEQCNDNVIYTIPACPAASLGSYPITWNGTTFLATISPGTAFSFRVALSGTTQVMIRASGNATFGWSFTIGLPAGTFDAGTFQGVTTAGARETVVLTSTTYAATRVAADGTTGTDSAPLAAFTPPGLRAGTRTSDGRGIFLMSSGPFAVVLGARTGPQAGYLELMGR